MSKYSLPNEVIRLAETLSSLPGIGPKQASRLSIYLSLQGEETATSLEKQLSALAKQITACSICGNIAEGELCGICANPARRKDLLLIVESVTDLLAIENTNHYEGRYLVLNKLIAPASGISPQDTNIPLLISYTKEEPLVEVIMALPATVEGEATSAYLRNLLQEELGLGDSVRVTQLARGIGRGVSLEYTDYNTLMSALNSRTSVD